MERNKGVEEVTARQAEHCAGSTALCALGANGQGVARRGSRNVRNDTILPRHPVIRRWVWNRRLSVPPVQVAGAGSGWNVSKGI